MHDETSKELRTTLTSAGKLELSIVTVPMPEPREGEVLVKGGGLSHQPFRSRFVARASGCRLTQHHWIWRRHRCEHGCP